MCIYIYVCVCVCFLCVCIYIFITVAKARSIVSNLCSQLLCRVQLLPAEAIAAGFPQPTHSRELKVSSHVLRAFWKSPAVSSNNSKLNRHSLIG